MTDDSELLRRYAEEDSEPAFAELVHRHLNAVYAAAVRQTRDVHAARDIVQIVFASLARQAKSLCDRPVLLSWLYTAVHYTAAKARRTEQRRQEREQGALQMQDMTTSDCDPDWDKLRPVLDEAMHDLAEPDREALLLRFFQGMTFVEMTRPLRVSEDGARKRVDRALDKLRGSLVRRGIASTSAALGATLSAHPPQEALPGLGSDVVGHALSGAKVAGPLAAVLAAVTLQRVFVAAAIVAVGGALFYQGGIIQLQHGELAEIQKRIDAAGAGERRARSEFADLSRQLDTARQQVVSGANSTSSASTAAWPSNPATEVVELLVNAARTGQPAPAVEYRTGPLDPSVFTVLPTPEAFVQEFFSAPGAPAPWPELIRAGIDLGAKARGLQEFMVSHGVLAGLVDSLRDTANLLQKDTGADADITLKLQSNYSAATQRVMGVALSITERPDERAEAIEVSKQIAALASAILKHLPPEYLKLTAEEP